MRTGPLTSLKVIELCNVVAGPFAGSLLADWDNPSETLRPYECVVLYTTNE